MTKAEYDALPSGPVPSNAERLLQAARDARDQAQRFYSPQCMSGADTADAPRYDLQADAFGCIASGKDVVAVLALCRAKWTAYCTENNAKVAAAPKISRGPSAGHSVIGHRHTSVGAWDSVEIFVRTMVAISPAKARNAKRSPKRA